MMTQFKFPWNFEFNIGISTKVVVHVIETVNAIIKKILIEDSDRKKLNNKYFIDLEFMLYLIQSKNLNVDWRVQKKEDDSFVVNTLFSSGSCDNIIVMIANLDSITYTLRWKKRTIYGDFRNYMKSHNQIGYKSNILACHYLEDIFYRNEMQEINWRKTFDFLRKGTSSKRYFTNVEDNALII